MVPRTGVSYPYVDWCRRAHLHGRRFAVAQREWLLASSRRTEMAAIRWQIAVLAVTVGVLPAACSHAPPPAPAKSPAAAAPAPGAPPPCTTPEPLGLTLQASAQVNPGEKGEALATVVRLYQLKGTGKLQGASFDDILDHDKETLGEDFVGVSELTINPGETLDPPLVRSPDANYLAAVALFRRPAGTTWRAVQRLAPPDPQHCHPPDAKKSDQNGGKDKTDKKDRNANLGAISSRPVTRFTLDENRVNLR